jgi:hypothetical protein
MATIEERLAALEAKWTGTGLGCPPDGPRHHVPTGYEPETARLVYDLLRAGSSKLAYSVASGFPLVEYAYTLEADFDSADTTEVNNVGQDQKVVQDSIIDEVVFQVQNQNTPAGLDSLTNEFFELQSGIEATMQIVGAAGGYQSYNFFTPIKLMCGEKKMWLITYNNGIVMNFNASVPLPFAVTVTFVFRCRTSYWRRLLEMTSYEALCKLKEMGFLAEWYEQHFCG